MGIAAVCLYACDRRTGEWALHQLSGTGAAGEVPAKDSFAQQMVHLPVSASGWRRRGRWQLVNMLALQNTPNGAASAQGEVASKAQLTRTCCAAQRAHLHVPHAVHLGSAACLCADRGVKDVGLHQFWGRA